MTGERDQKNEKLTGKEGELILIIAQRDMM